MNKKRIITSFLIASIIGVISFVSIFCGRRLFNYTGLTDAFFISGAIVVGIAGLIFTIRTGSFDVLNYGVYRLFESFKKGNEKSDATKALVKALKSDEVKDYIEKNYNGAVVPLF